MSAADNLNEQQFPAGPVSIEYAHNRNKAPNMGARFGQHVEPAGRYLRAREPGDSYDTSPEWETGSVTFQNPLHVEFGGGYEDESNWKHQLSAAHGGKTGRSLSRRLAGKGYDAVITHDESGMSEIVDLSSFRTRGRR